MSVRSLFVPTPNVETYPRYYLVQLLAKERIRCILSGDTFGDISGNLVQQYLEIPGAYQTAEAVAKFVASESSVVMAAFKRFEESPLYVEALKQLNPYAGNKFEVTSVTAGGIMVLIEVPESVTE